MEWLLLLLLVPAIVVPIVLQFAFAGCKFTPGTLSTYIGFTSVTPLSAESVELIWKSSHSMPTTWEIERTIGTNVTTFTVGPLDLDNLRAVDPALSAGTSCTYRVRALQGEPAGFSDPATVRTWARVFSSSLQLDGVNESKPGACIVQRVSPGQLDHGGNMIAVTIRGASNGELVVSAVTVSLPALASPDDYDSEGMPVDIDYGGETTVSAGSSTPLKPTDFEVNPDEALLIAFDIDSVSGNARVVRGVPHTAYLKLPPPGGTVTEAGTQNRAGFDEQANELWLIDEIYVATKWLPTP